MIAQTLRSTDVGAPQLAGNVPGSLLPVLDHFLLPLGWTKPFTDTNKAVYKMPPGTPGFYLRVDDTGTLALHKTEIRSYETMTDVDTGLDACPTLVQEPNWFIFKAQLATHSDDQPYTIHYDEGAFHLKIQYDNNGLPRDEHMYTYGLSQSFSSTDVHNVIIGACDDAVYHYTYDPCYSNGSGKYYIVRSPDGVDKSVPITFYDTLGSGFETNVYPDIVTGGFMTHEVYYRLMSGTFIGEICGKLPGVIYSRNRLSDIPLVSGDTFNDSDGNLVEIHRTLGQFQPTSSIIPWKGVLTDSDWRI